ncbi:4a-hydroxytetrahydrobiopterin dehydratase [Aliagarivorans marinus]|uniref:4a-hydroxytetrahydrobiopterin dehydratase n=1 Tax=Aliagarivorans marinus TaxID=561965 RepID=UPI00041F8412|nr:4a-hydroxytetrahydrobiopterin dehydratase [Aliagarivorans marinus]
MNDEIRVLEQAELSELLSELELWAYADNKLSKEFRFSDFRQAFAFMAEVAILAEEHDHHPDWSNSYNRVMIELTSHSHGGVTIKDISLAMDIEKLEL